ncbi:protein EFR3 homolog cmp44E isoform X2 [Drosophila sulfurigaster albostrigata]|uniref:Protein EFR3 homolog cmp44E isoform X2 n=1 Tax=Drosophila albomicans TaxID=7291 RepID=A0A6P8WI06_DROAB|nr:protein EFR3 homolog cmp44E isoform X2 [Drosophila albomicans]XP_060652458.1 protein EFR3 homolog cmp44E isoform X2 [Drosophila nasuta]XP_062128512.1 protein EFR3 homolog cmp44E isoform X2 [Drosophila sulfurigaster albostrigata]
MALIRCCFEPPELPEFFDSFVQKCTDPSCCCGCCSALRPRYKRLVDNIFPVNPEDGLVKSNMEKLTFYSLSSPDKLDRIGEYLYQKATKDINRKRYKLAEIAMEAMDLLLQACHAQTTLNLFVESFLRMVQKLLEDSNPNLKIMATNSFVKFANINEDTPSYHRRYDFFISKFSSMCHSDSQDLRDSLRLAGIKGLQGVIRKTVSDDLVENIWEAQHMEKIVPSLLFNMQSGDLTPVEDATNVTPPVLAEEVLRELVGRASFGHIRSVLKPLLTHLDRHELWVPNTFAIHTFRIVMISIQPQYSYTVVETLMQHLDSNFKSSPKTRTSLAVVLSKIIAIAAGESVGPSALDIINNLLLHLRTSVGTTSEITAEESQYQEALINALGEFANHHPDYQKIEIMLFIMNTVPDLSKKSKGDQMLQNILLKSLLKVGNQYSTVSFEKAFPASFLQPLLRMARAPHDPTRMIVMQIFQALLDRHQNEQVLSTVSVKPYPALSQEPPSRSDIIFTHKYGANIMQALIDSMALSDRVDALSASFNTAALLIVEMSCSETVQEFLLFILGVQQVASTVESLGAVHRCNLHAIAIALLVLISRVSGINNLLEYAQKIIEARRDEASYYLPPLMDTKKGSNKNLNLSLPHLAIDKLALGECMQNAGMDAQRLNTGAPYALNQSDNPGHRHSWVDSVSAQMTQRNSSADLTVYNGDVDSVNSSPGICKKILAPEFNFDAMKRALAEPTEAAKREQRERQMQIVRTFREGEFDDLMRRTEPKHDLIQNRLNELFNSLAVERQITQSDNKTAQLQANNEKPVYETKFPELFYY